MQFLLLDTNFLISCLELLFTFVSSLTFKRQTNLFGISDLVKILCYRKIINFSLMN